MYIEIGTSGDPSVGIDPITINIDCHRFTFADTEERASWRQALSDTFRTLLDEPVGLRFEDECPDCGSLGYTSEKGCGNPQCISREPGPIEKMLVEGKRKWTKGAYARMNGDPIASRDKRAECFCLSGMVRHCYEREEWDDIFRKLASTIQATTGYVSAGCSGENYIVNWNDEPIRKFEEVVQVVKEARV